MTEESKTHIDNWLDQPKIRMSEGEIAARMLLEIARMPAWKNLVLCRYSPRVTCLYKGERVHLIGASRLGHVYLGRTRTEPFGPYDATCWIDELSEFEQVSPS